MAALSHPGALDLRQDPQRDETFFLITLGATISLTATPLAGYARAPNAANGGSHLAKRSL
jgi:hypothetical protein